MSRNYTVLICLALFSFACNEPSDIGEGLLKDDKLELSFKNSFEIEALTTKIEDPISFLYYKNLLGLQELISPDVAIIGQMDDPKFGKINGSFYSRIVYSPNLPIPIFKNLFLDSAVLSFAYDTIGFYGDRSATQTIVIEELDESIKGIDSIYSSQKFKTKKIIGQKTFVPNFKDSISIINHADSSKIRVPAQVRIQLDREWAKALYNHPDLVDGPAEANSDELLNNVFKGIKVSTSSDGKGLIGLNTSASAIGSSGLTKLTLYFLNSSNKKVEYPFYFNYQKFNSFEIDNNGAEVENFIDNKEKSDSLLFVESMNGPGFTIDFKDLSLVKDKTINHAILEFTLAELPNDNLTKFNPVTQLMASYRDDKGKLIVIKDVSDLISSGLPLSLGFGGGLKSDKTSGKKTYSLNITKHLQQLLKTSPKDRKIYIFPNNRSIRPTRSIIYGPKHSTYPIKLNITYVN